MVLTPQLLQAIKLLQMPNLELTQFIENELTSNPLLERAEEREEPGSEPTDPPGFAEAPAEPGDWAGEALETDAGRLAANLGTEVDNAFDADRSAPSPSAPAEVFKRAGVDGGGRRRRSRRRGSPRSRSLRRRVHIAPRPSRAPGRDPACRPGRAHDRRRVDRRAGRGRIFRRLDRRSRREARRRCRTRRAGALAHANPGADRHLRALARRVPVASAQGARPL